VTLKSTPIQIPLHRPYVDPRASELLQQVIESGKLGGDGAVGKKVEQRLREAFGVRYALLTTSCTHALEMAMMMAGLHAGDEVILPSFTFSSTANAVIRAGGTPVFCEIDDQTKTMDPADVLRRITDRTKAIIPVHYAGVSAEMDDLMDIARRHKLLVVEDAAQGVNAKYKGKYLGTIGDIGAYSFHETKNYVSGEGGAFITNVETLARDGEVIREKGTNRANFLRGEVDKYTWVGVGSSFVLSELLAAFLKSQLDNLQTIQLERKRVHDLYIRELAGLENAGKIRLPVIPSHCESNYHIFYVMLRDEGERTRLMKCLKDAGIGSAFHYVPLHSSPYAVATLGTKNVVLPVTDKVYQTLLRLPIYPQLSNEHATFVVEKITECLK
jgi:dTDP-4-amino-4,6-dideoxygalactose transaminase